MDEENISVGPKVRPFAEHCVHSYWQMARPLALDLLEFPVPSPLDWAEQTARALPLTNTEKVAFRVWAAGGPAKLANHAISFSFRGSQKTRHRNALVSSRVFWGRDCEGCGGL